MSLKIVISHCTLYGNFYIKETIMHTNKEFLNWLTAETKKCNLHCPQVQIVKFSG